MGIKNLYQSIEKHAPASIRKTSTYQYVNQKIAVDASILLYQFVTSIVKDGEPLRNSSGQVTSHILGLIARCTRFAEAGVKPIFVFDGAAGDEKDNEKQRRIEQKEIAHYKAQMCRDQGDMAGFEKFQKRSANVTYEMTKQAYTVLDLMGLPYIQAPGEAEIACVSLCKSGVCTAVASSDLDCVCHGAPKFIRNIATDKEIIEIDYEYVLKGYGFTPEQFQQMCILMGCDYCATIPGVGPKRAYELISAGSDIYDIIYYNKSKINDTDAYVKDVYQALKVFASGADECKLDTENIKCKACNESALVEYLVNTLEFYTSNAQTKVQKYNKARKAVKQTTLSGFIKKMK